MYVCLFPAVKTQVNAVSKFGQQFFLKTLPGIGGDVRLHLVKFLYIRSEVSLYLQ